MGSDATEQNALTENSDGRLDLIFSMIEAEIKRQTKEEIKLIKEKAFEESEEKLYELQTHSQHNFSNLELLFEDNGERWINEIFKSITGQSLY